MIRKITIGFLVLASMLSAESVTVAKTFVGAEVGATEIQAGRYTDVNDATSFNLYSVGSSVDFGIKVGAENEEWRSTIVFNYYDSPDEDQNTEKLSMLLDYYVWSTELETARLRPYIGVNIGYINYESTFIEENGLTYGGQAGVAVGLSEVIDIDLSYRHSLADMDTVDHTASFMLGINYLY